MHQTFEGTFSHFYGMFGRENRRGNPETIRPQDTEREQTNQRQHKTKKMDSSDPTKYTGMNTGSRER